MPLPTRFTDLVQGGRPILLVALLWFCGVLSCFASLPIPLELELERAETVYIGRLIERPDRVHGTFQVVTALRGKAEGTMTFTWYATLLDETPIETQFLLVSQGDDHYGKPLPYIGMPNKGQGSWCGWLAHPIVTVKGHQMVGRTFTFTDDKSDLPDPSGKFSEVSLEKARELIDRFPYNPHINDQRK